MQKVDFQINRYERLLGKSIRELITYLNNEFGSNQERLSYGILFYKNTTDAFHNIGIRQPPTIPPNQIPNELSIKNTIKTYWVLGHFYTHDLGRKCITEVFGHFLDMARNGKAILNITVPDFNSDIIDEWEKWLDKKKRYFNHDFEQFRIYANKENIVGQVYQLTNLLLILIPIFLNKENNDDIWQIMYNELTSSIANPKLKSDNNSVRKGYLLKLNTSELINSNYVFPALETLLNFCLIIPLPAKEIERKLEGLKNNNYRELLDGGFEIQDNTFSSIIKPLIWRGQFQGIAYVLKRINEKSKILNRALTINEQNLFNHIIDEFELPGIIKDTKRRVFSLYARTNSILKKQLSHPYIEILEYLPLLSNVKVCFSFINTKNKYSVYYNNSKLVNDEFKNLNNDALKTFLESLFPKDNFFIPILSKNNQKRFLKNLGGLISLEHFVELKKFSYILVLKLSTIKSKKHSYYCLFYRECPEKIKLGRLKNEYIFSRNAKEIYDDIEEGINLIAESIKLLKTQNVETFKAYQILDAIEDSCELLEKEQKKINTTRLAEVYISPFTHKKVVRPAIEKYFRIDYHDEITTLSELYPNRWQRARQLKCWKQ